MKNSERVLRSLRRDRPMLAVTLRMPADVLARLEDSDVNVLVTSLRRRGVDEAVLEKALAEMAGKSQ